MSISTNTPEDELSPDAHIDTTRNESFDVNGVTFVIPIDAPIPSELADQQLPTGSLYKRLAPLDDETGSDAFRFIPISGAEILALERAWPTLQKARRVYILTGLPAARYDTLFKQATRNIGLPTVDWPNVSEALASKARTEQRKKDTEPWTLPEEERPRTRLPVSSTRDRTPKEVEGREDTPRKK